jgi:outer membrane lipoprotein LolB
MRGAALVLAVVLALAGCRTTHLAPPPASGSGWDQRVATLQNTDSWQLNGRAAVAVGTQGWQASLDWREKGGSAELHLAGPLGIGAQTITQTGQGLAINGVPASEAMLQQLQDKLGFDLPIENLRYWLLGVPDPHQPFDLSKNQNDRAQHLEQGGWSIDYDRYLPAAGDVLPAHLTMTRDSVRVRIVADRWDLK